MRFSGELLFRDEALDLVDGYRRVHRGARAGLLALLVADPAADRREGQLFADELERLVKAALGGELDIALDRDVRRACRLAGRGALRHDVRAVDAEVGIVVLARPQRVARRIGRAVLRGRTVAELHAELHGVELAVFHALAAGHALVLVHLGDVIGADRVRRAEVRGDAQRKARAAAAVADRRRILEAGRDVELVDKAVVLGALEDLIGLFLGDEAVRPGL